MNLNPRLLLALSGVPEDIWFQTTYAGLDDGWSEDDIGAFQRLSKAEQRKAVRGHLEVLPTPTPEAPRTRRSYRKREERLRDRTIRPGTYYARRHSLDPFFDARVSSGAGRTLLHLIVEKGMRKDRADESPRAVRNWPRRAAAQSWRLGRLDCAESRLRPPWTI